MAKREYIRMDPDWVEHLEEKGYPDGAIVAFGKALGAAEGQNPRGFFKNSTVLRGHLGRHARWIGYLIDHGDLIEQADGRIYFEGWEEWQEGDWKVRERVARIRNRTKPGPKDTPPTVTSVTPPSDTLDTATTDTAVTEPTVSLPSDRYREPLAVSRNRVRGAVDGGVTAAVRASKKSTGHPMGPEATALVQGYQELGYPQPSASDLIRAGEYVAELRYLTVPEMLDRMREHLAWCQRERKPQPQSLGGFWKTLRRENDHRCENGAQPPDRSRASRSGVGLTAIGDVAVRVLEGGTA